VVDRIGSMPATSPFVYMCVCVCVCVGVCVCVCVSLFVCFVLLLTDRLCARQHTSQSDKEKETK